MVRRLVLALGCLWVAAAADGTLAAENILAPWHTDYTLALEAAKEQHKYLLIHFHQPQPNAADRAFVAQSVNAPGNQKLLHNFECASLPLDASILISGRQTRLIDHSAFAELQHRQGIAVLDFRTPGSEHYGDVVTVLPFKSGRYLGPNGLRTVLTLPTGTLTQRTMIYAVRTHPERPGSTTGQFDPILASEAQSHSRHQAQIRVQGHHGWGHRFQRILGRLGFGGRGGAPVEVVAESWPGQGLVEAAEDCVHSWRQSSGHWDAVSDSHGAYGYDMKRGANGIWYATGIFAGFRR